MNGRAAYADGGPVTLSHGGAKLTAADGQNATAMHAEYPALYHRFSELAVNGESDVDLAPLQLVADAFLLGRRRIVEPFEDEP